MSLLRRLARRNVCSSATLKGSADEAVGSRRVPNTLITIPFSHYCELARWALDASGVAYAEVATLPGFHVPTVAYYTAGRHRPKPRSGTSFVTPVLLLDDGVRVLNDAHEIAKHACQFTPLYPAAAAAAIDDDLTYFHDRLGPLTRRFAYHHLFTHVDAAAFADMSEANAVPAWQTAAVRRPFVYAKMRQYICTGLGVTEARALKAKTYITNELDAVAARLQLQRSAYLHGGSRTLADLSFASMLAPVLGLPPRSPAVWMPEAEALGEEFAAAAEAFRAHDAGRFAVELIRGER